MDKISVSKIQEPLRAQYKTSPETARVIDRAIAKGEDASDPFHSAVEPMLGSGAILPVGVHRALGGMHDAPTSGDILCAALAACQDSAVRMVANFLGIGYGDQKQIQRRRTMGAAIDVVIADQAVVQPTELSLGVLRIRSGQMGCLSTMAASLKVKDIVAKLLHTTGGHGDVIL